METSVMTVMFTDLVGSVKMYNKVSDSVAVDLVKKLETRIQGLMPQMKGKFIKSTGDGQLLTFEDVQGSLACAKEIHRLCDTLARDNMQELAVRIALHTGELFHGDGDIHGNTVNLAARLLSVTGACETSVTSETWQGMSAAERDGFIPHGPEVFKGFNRFSIVYRKPNPNPMTDVTFRPEAMEGDDSSMVVVEAMPKHKAYLVTLEHPQVKKDILIKEGETHVFGRAPECATVVPDKMFSGTHGALAVNDGILWVFDLQSSNGILYRGRKVKRRKPLRTNDVLQLPAGTMQVKLPPA